MPRNKNLIKKWYRVGLVLFGILAIAFFIRVYNLNHLPVFADEAIYVRWAQVMRAEPSLRFLPLSDGKQPFFMWVAIPFLKVFSDPLIAGRFVSVLAGLGTTVGIFALSWYLFKSKKAALVAALVYAISPFGVFFDRMALVDSLLTMFGIWTLFLAAVTVKTLRLDFAMLTGFALGGALLTKSPALFFVLLLPTVWLISVWPKKTNKRLLHLIKLASLLAVTFIIGYGMYNILRLGPEFHMLSIRNYDYVYPFSHIFESPFNPLVSHLKAIFDYFWSLGPGAVLFLALLGTLAGLKKRRTEVILILLWFLIPLLASAEYSKVMTARYILFTFPFLVTLAGIVFEEGRGIIKRLAVIGLILFIVQSLLINRLIISDVEKAPLPGGERSGYLSGWTAGTGIYEIAELIKKEYLLEPDRQIVVGTEGYFGTLPDGLQIYLNDYPEIIVIGVGVLIEDLPESLAESKEAGNKTYLVVNNFRLKADPEELGLNLKAAYPKTPLPDGEQEALYFFELTEKVD